MLLILGLSQLSWTIVTRLSAVLPTSDGWVIAKSMRFHIATSFHPHSYSLGTEGSFPGGKVAGAWSWSNLFLVPKVKNVSS